MMMLTLYYVLWEYVTIGNNIYYYSDVKLLGHYNEGYVTPATYFELINLYFFPKPIFYR